MTEFDLQFEKMRKAFCAYFEQEPNFLYDKCSDRFKGGDKWEYAVVKGASNANIHYELICRGQELYIELHVETHPRNVPCWDKLQRRLADDTRHFVHFTYYSSSYWRTRTPICSEDDLHDDLKHITEIVESVFDDTKFSRQCIDDCDIDIIQDLPFQRNPKRIAQMLGENGILRMPAVQRGKVWNASRIEALWDSVLRGFSIGSFSVQKLDGHLDLLDGQQRSSSLALAYAEFPPIKGHELDTVLWLDINPKEATIINSQKQFMVYVTTASQPWGYASSSDEIRNVLLSISERRESLVGKQWHDENKKPYPGELPPYRAEMPVPLNLLIQFAESDCDKTIAQFINWCDLRRKESASVWWDWLKPLNGIQETKAWKNFFEYKTRDGLTVPRKMQLEEFPVFFIDAGSVDENDISLYFTRVGKGGVRPSDEELAYSVLKSKLGSNFKNSIDNISLRYGLAHPARVAHLAIRCFNSTKNSFFGTGVLDAVLRICKRGSDGDCEEGFQQFNSFVNGGEFERLIEEIDKDVFGLGESCLTQWHRNRFCNYHNGDVYLFLLLAKKFDIALGVPLPALAEVIFEKAMNPDRTIRYIMEKGVQEGIAQSMRETYRGMPRFGRIPRPQEFDSLVKAVENGVEDVSRLKDLAKERHLDGLISTGYGNQKSYAMLLYACKNGYKFGNEEEYYFGYNPYLGIWSEDNCPWDYDHILPHSWIEKMPSGAESDVCMWLMNSIGNLAPLPFEINRSLSDESRDSNYPYCIRSMEVSETVADLQREFSLNGQQIGKMAKFRSKEAEDRAISIRAFCVETISRFCRLYHKWYEGLQIEKVLSCLDVSLWPNRIRCRRELLIKIADMWGEPRSEFRFLWHDSTERIIEGAEDWYVWDWVSVSRKYKSFSLEVTINRDFSECEFGVCKLASETRTNEQVRNLMVDSIGALAVKNDDYWYAVKKISPEKLVDYFNELLEIEKIVANVGVEAKIL